MAKSILDYPILKFRQDVVKVSTKQLLRLIQGIYEFKWSFGKVSVNKLTDSNICDLERKETIIEAELIRRKYINPRTRPQYDAWIRSINFKKRLF